MARSRDRRARSPGRTSRVGGLPADQGHVRERGHPVLVRALPVAGSFHRPGRSRGGRCRDRAGRVARPSAAGVETALDLCRRRSLSVAIASSSEYRLIEAVLGHFGLVVRVPCGALRRGGAVRQAASRSVPHDRATPRGGGLRVAWCGRTPRPACWRRRRHRCRAWPCPRRAERDRPEILLADVVLDSLVQADDQMWERLVAVRARRLPGAVSTPL